MSHLGWMRLVLASVVLVACSEDIPDRSDLGADRGAKVDLKQESGVPDRSVPPDGQQLADLAGVDIKVPDSSAMDQEIKDTGTPDAVLKDTGALDSTVPDAAVPDAASPDSALPDMAPDLSITPGCSAGCQTKAPYLCNKNSYGTCVECTKDSHCTGNPWSLGNKCNTSYFTCVCSVDADCVGKKYGTKCDAAAELCGCLSSTHCVSPLQCSATLFGSKVCAGPCKKDSDCASPSTPKCQTASGNCVACTADAHCTSSSAPYCLASSGTCVACKSDKNCPASVPVCDMTKGSCTGCTKNSQCSGAAEGPTCDTKSGTCGCATDSQCSSTSDWGTKCISVTRLGTTFKICGCDKDAHCATKIHGLTCHGGSSRCGCTSNAGCKVPPYSTCSVPHPGASYKQCQQACAVDKDCTDKALPYCVGSSCVACKVDSQCSASGNKHCLNNSCVQCKVDADCTVAANKVCDTASHSCVACKTVSHCQTLYGYPWYNVCDGGKKCVECIKDSDCTASSLGKTCNTSFFFCYCTKDADCAGNTNGLRCHTSWQTCTCAVDGDCPTGKKCSGSTPFMTKFCK